MAKTTKKTVAKKKTTALSKDVIDMSADAGKGLEGADAQTYAMPFLTVLQGLSPQIGVVKGATPGQFINTITNELADEVMVIPCAFQRRFLCWAPRESGGGFKGSYSPLEVEGGTLEKLTKNEDTGQPMLGDNILKDTRIHYVLVKSANGAWKPAVLSLNSTQIKKSKRFMSLIQGLEVDGADGEKFNPPSFSHMYKLTTVKESNEKGSWWGIEFEVGEKLTSAPLYDDARKFSQEVNAGAVTAADPKAEPKEDF